MEKTSSSVRSLLKSSVNEPTSISRFARSSFPLTHSILMSYVYFCIRIHKLTLFVWFWWQFWWSNRVWSVVVKQFFVQLLVRLVCIAELNFWCELSFRWLWSWSLSWGLHLPMHCVVSLSLQSFRRYHLMLLWTMQISMLMNLKMLLSMFNAYFWFLYWWICLYFVWLCLCV